MPYTTVQCLRLRQKFQFEIKIDLDSCSKNFGPKITSYTAALTIVMHHYSGIVMLENLTITHL